MIDETLIESISSDELADGFRRDEASRSFVCLRCGAAFEDGRVYSSSGGFSTAARAVREHAASAHGDPFVELLGAGKETTGVPDAMAEVLRLLYEGKTDKEIAAALGGKSPSTVRNQRRALRKRESEAKIFLALMKLLERKGEGVGHFVSYPAGMPMQDERALVTDEEAAAIERKYLAEDGSLSRIPRKEKEKLVILRKLAGDFIPGRLYAQKEVDAILTKAHEDYAALRRYLVDYRFLEREPDGSAYWVADAGPEGR